MTAEKTFRAACECALKAEEYERRGMRSVAAFARARARELLQDAMLFGTGWTRT